MARLLAVDFGKKRIGLAISDELQKIAFRYKTIQNISFQKTVKELKNVIEKESIEKIIFGLPLSLKGKDSEITKKARSFYNHFKKEILVPIVLRDERFSTKLAQKTLSFRKAPKELLDQEAARIILEDYLKENSAQ